MKVLFSFLHKCKNPYKNSLDLKSILEFFLHKSFKCSLNVHKMPKVGKKLAFLENEDQAKSYLKNKIRFEKTLPITFSFGPEQLLDLHNIDYKKEEEYEKNLIYSGIHLESMKEAKKICDVLKIRYRGIELTPLFYMEIYLTLVSSKKFLRLLSKIIKKEAPKEIIVLKNNSLGPSEEEFCSKIVSNIFKGKISFHAYYSTNKKNPRNNLLVKGFSSLQKKFTKALINFTGELDNNIFMSGGNLYFKPIVDLLSLNKKNRFFTFDSQLRKSFFSNKRYVPFYEFSGKECPKQELLKKDLLNLKKKVIELNFYKEFGVNKGIEKILKDKLIFLIETKFFWISRKIEEIHSLMKKNKINLILLASDNSFFEIAILEVAKIFKIPSIVIQHAINCTEIAFPRNSEYIFVFGSETKKWLVNNISKKNKIFVIGCPRYDKFISKKKKKRSEKSILYIMEATNSNKFFPERSLTKKRQKQLLKMLFKVLKKFPEYKFIIKTRSNWDMAKLPSIMAKQEGFTNLEIIEKTDNLELLNNSEIVIINHTTMGIEALLLNKPVISISFKDLDDGNPYKKMKIVDTCYNEKQLESAITKNKNQNKWDISNRGKILKNYLLNDGHASKRAVYLANNILQKN